MGRHVTTHLSNMPMPKWVVPTWVRVVLCRAAHLAISKREGFFLGEGGGPVVGPYLWVGLNGDALGFKFSELLQDYFFGVLVEFHTVGST